MKKLEYTLITQANALSELCSKATNVGTVSVDTEFMREKVYYAELCLLQIAIEQHYYLVDILAFKDVSDLTPLAALMANKSVVKLFHSCSQDVEVLYYYLKVIPENIFDTQLAAAFCGYDGQVGYANLVAVICGVELDKSQTRTNWQRRPLSEEQLEYAINDVVYLQALYETFLLQLKSRQRMQWFECESQSIVQSVVANADPERAYKRLNGGSLSLSKQALLKSLANLREHVAQQSDKPRPWVLKDSDLYDVVNAMPDTERALLSLGIRSGFIQRNAEKIVHFVNKLDENNLELVWGEWQPLNSTQKSQVKIISKKLNEFAKEKEIARSVIGNRKDIENFVAGRVARFQSGWRAELLGDILVDELRNALN